MKKLFCLGLCLLMVAFMFTACLNTPGNAGTTSGDETTTPVEEESTTPGDETHNHVFAAEWTTDATNHWHAATCDHKDEKKDLGAHADTNNDNKCDTCAYVMAYAVTVTAPQDAVVDKAAQAVAVGSDATFSVTYSAIYRLSADNAVLVDTVDNEDGTITWNFKVAAPTADTAVTVSAEKIVYGAPVAAGPVVFEDCLDAWKFYPGPDITVTLEAGDYYAYFLDGNGNAALGLSEDDCSTMGYAFTVEEAGEITFKTRFFSEGYEEATDVTATYIILKDEDVTLSATSGEGYILPTNVTSELVFTVPAPGLYALTTTVDGIILNDDTNPSYIFMATEAGQEIRVPVKYEDMTNVVFEFDWNVALVDGDALALGENDAVIALEGYTAFTFTAPAAGSYSFVADGEFNYFFYWNSEYEYLASEYSNNYIAKNLEAGEKILVLIKCHDYEATEDVADVITVTYAGILVEEGENTVAANGEGTTVTFPAPYQGWFNLIAGENTLIGIVAEDETVTWVSEYEICLADGESFAFLVKTADGAEADVALTIENVVYAATLYLGENTLTLAPGKEYSIDLDGINYFGAYLLSWENADVTIAVNGEEYVSGTEMTYYFEMITAINNGTETVDVVIILVDPMAQANTAAKLDGKFEASFPGIGVLYELTFTPDADTFTGTLEVVDNNSFTYGGTYTYAVTTTGGVVIYKDGEETMDILISLDYWGDLTFQCPGLRMPLTLEAVNEGGDIPAGPAYDGAISGEDGVYSVDVDVDVWIPYVIGYTAPAEGYYVISPADGELNAWIDGWYYNDGWGDWDREWASYIEGEGSYSFYLAEGQTIYFWVYTWNEQSDIVDLVITADGNGGNDDAPVVDGGYDGALYGDNGVYSVNVDNPWGLYVIGFVATEAGTYVLSTAEGEENAYIDLWYYNENFGDWDREWNTYIAGAGSYSFELEAGESIYFMVLSNNDEADVIDLVISAAVDSNRDPMGDDIFGQ